MARTDYTRLTARDAAALLPARRDDAASVRDLVAGDQWQAGVLWLGEMPDAPQVREKLARGIVSENVCHEGVWRHMAGVLGREPRWGLVPNVTRLRRVTPAEQAVQPSDARQATRIAEIEDALIRWWDARGVLHTLRDALAVALQEDRCPLRLYVPEGKLDDQGRVPRARSLDQALSYLYLDRAEPAAAGVHVANDTRQPLGIFVFSRNGQTIVEVTYTDALGNTVIRQLGGEATQADAALALGGRLPIMDLERQSILTRQIIQNQKALTLTLTQMMRNINLAGNREKEYIGVRPPGTWEVVAEGTPGAEYNAATRQWERFVPGVLQAGPGKRTFYDVETYEDNEGVRRPIVNPHINTTEPVSVDHFIATAAQQRQIALNQMQQGHVLMNDQATASGRSRAEARGEYKTSLQISAAAVDHVGRWLIETALAFAAVFMGQPTLFADLRCEFGAIVDTGPLSPEEREQLRADVEAGLLDRETYLSLVGHEDPDAILARIKQEREELDPVQRVNLQRSQEALERDRQAAAAPVFALGDRVRVTGPAHMPGQRTGRIALVNGSAYGIIFDGMESMGVHKWYVAEELERINTPAPTATEQAGMADMEM